MQGIFMAAGLVHKQGRFLSDEKNKGAECHKEQSTQRQVAQFLVQPSGAVIVEGLQNRAHKKGQGKNDRPKPGGLSTQPGIYCKGQPPGAEETQVVPVAPLSTAPYYQCYFIGFAVAFLIAQVVQVQYAGTKKANTGGRKQHLPVPAFSVQVVGARNPQQAKKDKNISIAQSTIAIGTAPNCITDGCSNGCQSQNQKQKRLQQRRFKSHIQQPQSRHQSQEGTKSHRPFHLFQTDDATLNHTLGTQSVGPVGSGNRIAVVVGQIRENL